jgi:hypothetical protein
MRIKTKEIAGLRTKKILSQNGLCAICNINLDNTTPCLDHSHVTGKIRDVLCLNCNGIEGKIFNLCRRAKRETTEREFLLEINKYWIKHSEIKEGDYIHPNHKTEDEKRISKNKKARNRRKKIKKN